MSRAMNRMRLMFYRLWLQIIEVDLVCCQDFQIKIQDTNYRMACSELVYKPNLKGISGTINSRINFPSTYFWSLISTGLSWTNFKFSLKWPILLYYAIVEWRKNIDR